ncbi:uncharacterized membrane protein YkvA (DUF1232 family) [Pontibacter ummariensis]|uniref:Uncharacterized membrane protein YkvA, DUF1232 family n=1 Tax=Pontibacter ummariensis TaxID=1610492 RepID=A0A239FM57_9BACT|nr:YkvA family protein [Pontibacter ummariensis]PRY12010.1 uncharacterized membrane protein YkvA (DUF1232 family) [Pontibacter ummariensis]SNS57955.1 Uncharacterized membrane protein YkvA, DUF1232 family [Pontibacter ummariensis]
MLNDWIHKGLVYSQNPLFKKFMGKASGLFAKPLKMGLMLTTAYKKLVNTESTASGFDQVKDYMQTFIRLVKAYMNGDYRNVATKSLVIGVAVLLYFVSPLDIIPDFLPALGILDDISLMAWFMDTFQKEIVKFRQWESDQNFDHYRIGSL